MKKLSSESEISEALAALPAWHLEGDEIRAEFQAADFLAMMAFVNEVATRAEAADHHPDIDIRYNRVALALSSHSDGGLTAKDFAMAGEIDAAALSCGARGIDRGH